MTALDTPPKKAEAVTTAQPNPITAFRQHFAALPELDAKIAELPALEAKHREISAAIEVCDDDKEMGRLLVQLAETDIKVRTATIRNPRWVTARDETIGAAARLAGPLHDFITAEVKSALGSTTETAIKLVEATMDPLAFESALSYQHQVDGVRSGAVDTSASYALGSYQAFRLLESFNPSEHAWGHIDTRVTAMDAFIIRFEAELPVIKRNAEKLGRAAAAFHAALSED